MTAHLTAAHLTEARLTEAREAAAVVPAIGLADDEIGPFLATSRGYVVVEFASRRSSACRLLRPVMTKLAVEFAGHAEFAAVDADEAPRFRAERCLDEVPQVMVFRNGVLVDRAIGFQGAERLGAFLAAALRRPPAGADLDAAFAAAALRAERRFEEATAPARARIAPQLAAIARAMAAFEASLGAARLDKAAGGRLAAEYERLSAPFRADLDALAAAEALALAAYEAVMAEALEDYLIALMPRGLWVAGVLAGP